VERKICVAPHPNPLLGEERGRMAKGMKKNE
jgi:hypothetical protein